MECNKISQLLVVLLVILLSSTPASAQYLWNGFQLNGDASNADWVYNGTVASGTVYGNVYVDCGHGLDYANPPSGYVQEFSVPAHSDVELARLYVGVWHGTENHQGKLKVEYTSTSGTNILYANSTDGSGNLTLGGVSDNNDNVWSGTHGVDWIWYDVTNLVEAGVNTATGYTHKISNGFDGRIYGFKLVVVYEDTAEPQVMYWINQGHDALSYATSGHPERNNGTAHFDGTITPGDWEYAMLHCTWVAGDRGDQDTLKFNGHVLDNSCTNYEQGAYLDSRWYVVDPSYLLESGNYAEYSRDTDNYAHWMGAELVLFSEEPQPDLKIASMDDPVLVGHDSTHGYLVGHIYTIDAVVTNQRKASSCACQVALYGGAGLEDTVNIGALGPGCSESLTFNWTPTVTGTVALKAVADNLGQVTESDETNNDRTKSVEVLSAGRTALYQKGNNNVAGQSDDGDNMMPSNAFLVVEYATNPATPFLIDGWINCTSGDPVNDPNVTVTNMDTGEVFVAGTYAGSNYYQILTSSYSVSTGDVLHFTISSSNSTEFDHTVTASEMNAGGFTQNAAITCGATGICGDIDDDGDVDMDDVMTMWYDIANYPAPGAYTISNAWAADVDCDGDIDMDDVMILWYDVANYPTPGASEVNCC